MSDEGLSMEGSSKVNPCGITPITVQGSPSSVTDFPSTLGSPAKCRIQNRCESTTT